MRIKRRRVRERLRIMLKIGFLSFWGIFNVCWS